MSKATECLEKLADRFEYKLEKVAQVIGPYPFNPTQDFLALKAKANLDLALSLANKAVPDSFKSGNVTVSVKVLKNKSFTIVSNINEAAQALKPTFDNKIKELLVAAGPVNNDVLWTWFVFAVSEE